MAGDYYPFFEPSRRRRADGIRARSQRGRIGETWWSTRFIAVLESFNMGARLTRGRSYARTGQVMDLSVGKGVVEATVQGSRARPYRVSIRIKPLPERDWVRVENAMAARALFMAKLLAGEMPDEIEEAFAGTKLSVFPASRRSLVTDCTCPDWGNPCKHVAAVYYILAERFDEDPFLIFAWRGRTKEELIGNLRARRSRTGRASRGKRNHPLTDEPSSVTLSQSMDSFWQLGADLSELQLDPTAGGAADALLLELGPLPREAGGSELSSLLGPAYKKMAEKAEKQASR